MKALLTLVCLLAVTFLQPLAAQADNYQRWVNVNNYTTKTIYYVRISNKADPYWGDDLLGSDSIQPGQYIRVYPGNLQGYCKADIQAEYEDRSTAEIMNFNICEVTDVNFVD